MSIWGPVGHVGAAGAAPCGTGHRMDLRASSRLDRVHEATAGMLAAAIAGRTGALRSRAGRRAVAAAAAAVVVSVGVSGCAGDRSEREGSTGPHGESSQSGPLRTSLGSGGNGLTRPPGAGAVWPATFGGVDLCATTPVVIDSVEAVYADTEPQTVTWWLRTVPDREQRTGPQLDWAPVLARSVSWEQLLASGQVKSSSVVPAFGARVEQPCAVEPKARDGFTELVTAMEVDEAGAWIEELRVRYRVGGEEYTLVSQWDYVACGSSITDRNLCG